MTEPTHYSQTSLSYARAMLELAEEQRLPLEALAGDLNGLREILDGDEAFRLYLADPAIGIEERWELLKRVFAGRISPVVLHTLGVLNEKGRLKLLHEIIDAFDDLLDQKLGKVEVDLIVAHKLTAEQLEDAQKRISQALKREAVVHPYVDENIIGGVVLRVGDQLIDGSVRNQLQTMKDKLLAARPQ